MCNSSHKNTSTLYNRKLYVQTSKILHLIKLFPHLSCYFGTPPQVHLYPSIYSEHIHCSTILILSNSINILILKPN